MQNRRGFLLTIVTGFVALAFVGTVIADELIGVLSKVDVEGKELTIIEKETEKEVKVKVNADTKQMFKGEEREVDLEKLDGFVKKAIEKGKKGVNVKVTHEKNVASKIEFQKKKKAAQ